MSGQALVVVGFLDQISAPARWLENHTNKLDRIHRVGNKHAIAVLRRVEQVLLLRLSGLGFLVIAQDDELIAALCTRI
jgi:hypothetical protein